MIDIKQIQDGDIAWSNGDLLYVESSEQHQRDILLAGKGHFKSFPLIGVDAMSYVSEENPDMFLRIVRKEFSRDGMTVEKVSTTNIEAYY